MAPAMPSWRREDRLGRRERVEAEGLADVRSIAGRAASTSSRSSSPPMGRSASMRPSTTLASVTVGRSLPRP